MKKTKIVATMSDFRCTEEFVKQLFDAGMDVVRVNSAHVSEDGATHIVETVHRVNPAIPIMIDTKGPEIRVTTIADEYGNSINFRPGDRVAVRGSDGSDFTTRKVVYMNVPSIVSDIPVGARMLIADGELEIRVVGKNDTELDCEFVVGGAMRSRKSVNVPGVSIDLPSVTEKDRRFIEWAVKNDVDFIAHSFERSAGDVHAVQEILDRYDSPIKIISKIESLQGIQNLEEIIEVSDGIMVARGDMGVEIPLEDVPVIQKMIIKKVYDAGKKVITATQMLDSMMKHPRPTRAEATDVANAIYDGTSAIMLSGETAAGMYPIEALKTMVRIAVRTEQDINYLQRFKMRKTMSNPDVTNAISHATCTMAGDLNAAAIITVTKSGRTARMVSKYRPNCPIIGGCLTEKIYRQLALSWGVIPLMIEEKTQAEELFDYAVDAAEAAGIISKGDVVVLTAGVPLGVSGTTNLIKVQVAGHILVEGQGIGTQKISANLCVCHSDEDLKNFKVGDIIVAKDTSNAMMTQMREASGLIVEASGENCHAAIAGLSLDIPVLIGAKHALDVLKSSAYVELDCENGLVTAN